MDSAAIGVVIGVISAIGAVAAAVIAWMATAKGERIAKAQQKVATHIASSEWLRDLRVWASDAIDILAEASYVCSHADKTESACVERLLGLRHKLSALIDRGRFFLPNQSVANVGDDKPSAYRGWRHAALDPLVAAERVVSGEIGGGRFRSRSAALVEMRRIFVSDVQRILAPDIHNHEVAEMIRSGSERLASDRTLGGLLPDENKIPTGANRLLFDDGDRGSRESRPVV